MLNILHYGLSPNRGGIETYLDKLWLHIDKETFHFDFIDEWEGKAYFREKFENEGAIFYDITHRRRSVRKNVRQWDQLLRECPPDILHCHLNTLSYVQPIRSAIKQGIPVIVHSRSSGMKISKVSKRFHKWNSKWLKGQDIWRIAVSKNAGEWLFGKDSYFTVINNSVDIEHFEYSDKKRNVFREQMGIDLNTFVVGNVGSLSVEKNQKFLLRIFKQLKMRHKNCKLLIAGEGYLRTELERYAKLLNVNLDVHFLGNIVNIDEMLSALDVFVMPSISEGFPNAVLEAQANGLQCIVSDSVTKEVDVGLCEYISLKEDDVKWATIVDKYKKPYERDYIKQRTNIQAFSIEKEISRIEGIYREVCGK